MARIKLRVHHMIVFAVIAIFFILLMGAASLVQMALSVPDPVVDPGFFSYIVPYCFLIIAWAFLTFVLIRLAVRGQLDRLEGIVHITGIKIFDWVTAIALAVVVLSIYLTEAEIGGNGASSIGVICAVIIALPVIFFSYFKAAQYLDFRYASIGMLVAFIFLVMGIPELWHHTSANAAVFGRYDLDFFLLLLVYHVVVITCGALLLVLIAAILADKESKVEEVYHRLRSKWWLALLIVGVAWAGWYGFRWLTRTRVSTMPAPELALLVLAVILTLIVVSTPIQRCFTRLRAQFGDDQQIEE